MVQPHCCIKPKCMNSWEWKLDLLSSPHKRSKRRNFIAVKWAIFYDKCLVKHIPINIWFRNSFEETWWEISSGGHLSEALNMFWVFLLKKSCKITWICCDFLSWTLHILFLLFNSNFYLKAPKMIILSLIRR